MNRRPTFAVLSFRGSLRPRMLGIAQPRRVEGRNKGSAARIEVGLTSDTHGRLPIVHDVDAILHAGDIGPDVHAVEWFRDQLYPWAARFGKPIYATFGNHDFIGERHQVPHGAPSNLHFVVDEERDVFGVKVWFSPWSPTFFDWAFMEDDDVLAGKYARIPEHIEVLVTHGPPFGAGDLNLQSTRCGSAALANRIAELPHLRLVVCGHIHEAFGDYRLGDVDVYNVSLVDVWYRATNSVVVIDWPE